MFKNTSIYTLSQVTESNGYYQKNYRLAKFGSNAEKYKTLTGRKEQMAQSLKKLSNNYLIFSILLKELDIFAYYDGYFR